MEESSTKRIIAIIAYAILLISGFQKFITNGNEAITTFKVKGFLIVLIAYTFVIYSASVKKIAIQIIAYLIALAGYGYTFYTLYNIYNSNLNFEMGFYMYAGSALILIISMFISNGKKVNQQEETLNKSVIQNNAGQSSKYVYGTYLYGFDKTQEYSNHRCAIAQKSNNDLVIILSKEQVVSYEIKADQIERIAITRSLAMKKNDEDPAIHANEDKMLGYAMGGALGLIIADNMDNRDTGGKLNYSSSYLVEIIFKYNNESRKLLIDTDYNPDNIFQVYGSIYEKKA